MPIYEYEHDEHGPMCEERFAVIQGINDAPLQYCPACGLACHRVVSRVSVKVKNNADPEAAAKRGFTTFKRSGEGAWEKVAGPGVDAIVGTEEDKKAVKEKPKKVVDLDKP